MNRSDKNRINYTWEAQKAIRDRAFRDWEQQRQQDINDAVAAYERTMHPKRIPMTRKQQWQLALMFLASAVISAAGVYFLIAEALHQIEVGLGKTFGY